MEEPISQSNYGHGIHFSVHPVEAALMKHPVSSMISYLCTHVQVDGTYEM